MIFKTGLLILGIIIFYSNAEIVNYDEAKQFLIKLRACVLAEKCSIDTYFLSQDSVRIIRHNISINDTSFIDIKEGKKLKKYLLEVPFQMTWNFYDEKNSEVCFCFCDNSPKFINQKSYLQKNQYGTYRYFDAKSNQEAICKCDAILFILKKDSNTIKIHEVWVNSEI